MSKTAQRKREAYEQGVRDGAWGYGFRWSRHPFMVHYGQGFQHGQQRAKQRIQAEREMKDHQRWYNRALSWLASKVAV
jgi:hypothetical protein